MIEMDGVTDSEEEVIQHLKQLIRKQIGGFAIPEAFLVRASHMHLQEGQSLHNLLGLA